MAARANISMPTAVLLGSLIVGIGLFLGLRDRGVVAPPPAPVATVPAEAPSPPVPPLAPVATREQVTRQATEALGYHHRALRESCYVPAVAGEATPRPVKMIFNVTFDAGGNQVMRGVTEMRGAAITAVTSCVTDQLPALRVPPPGAPMKVDIPLEFP